MKKFKYFLSFLLLILLIFTSVSEVFAMSTGFSVTDSFSDEEKEHIIKTSKVRLLKEEPVNEAILCFDVNKDGLIAIGTKNISDIYYVCIYNSDGIFQYGYSFVDSGSFGIEFDNENIIIYFVRSNIVISVDPSGEVLEIAKVDNTMENTSYRHILRNTERQINDIKYKIKNDMGIFNLFVGQSSYSQLVKIDGFENQTILYDVNSKAFAKTLMIFIFALLFIATAVIVPTKLTIKSMRQYKQEQQRSMTETQRNNSYIPLEDD